MIEVLDVEAREVKGDDYHYYIQAARYTEVDRRGLETVEIVDVRVDAKNPLYKPADDYVVHPSATYVRHYQDRNGRNKKGFAIALSPKLIRVGDLVAELTKLAKAS